MAKERRSYPRYKLDAPEMFDMGAENGGLVTDVCERGVGFQVVSPMEKDRTVNFAFSLGSNELIRAQGRVAWVSDEGKTGGMEFTSVPGHTRKHMQSWLESSMPGVHAAPEAESVQTHTRAVIPSGLGLSPGHEAARASTPAPPFAPAPAFTPAPAPEIEPAPPLHEVENIFSRTPFGQEQSDMDAGGHKNTITLMLVVLLIVAGFTFTELFPSGGGQILAEIQSIKRSLMGPAETSGAAETQKRAAGAADAETSAPASAPASPSASPSLAPTLIPPDLRGRPAKVAPKGRAGVKTAPYESRGETEAARLVNASSSNAGLNDYQTGERYLAGRGVPPDASEAARWFWKAEENGYTPAGIALADLYLRGEGVARSCLQARILLTAAVKENNQQAASKLRLLPENCE